MVLLLNIHILITSWNSDRKTANEIKKHWLGISKLYTEGPAVQIMIFDIVGG